jgi:hypothetical protein
LFVAAILAGNGHLVAESLSAQSRAQASYEQAALRAASSSSGLGLIRFNGHALDEAGHPMQGVVGVTFAIYEEQSGGAPLWQETQNLTADANGRFRALLGASSPAGALAELFSSGDARWLGVLTHSPGVSEQPRVLLVSVPYAMQAANAGTLGGLPASAFARASATSTANAATDDILSSRLVAVRTASPASSPANSTTPGSLPVFTDASGDIGNSAAYQAANGYVGIGTTTPAFNLDIASTADPAAIVVEGFGNVGVNFIGRRAEGTPLVPSGLLANDNIMTLQGRGYGKTAYSPLSRAYLKFFAAENWTDSAQGAYISFATTPQGSAPTNVAAPERMRITDAGNVGIGTTAPDQMLTVAGTVHSTGGGFMFPDGSLMTSAATFPGVQPSGNLILGAGTGPGGEGNLGLQTPDSATNTMSDRLLIVGQPKAMSGPVPMANLFSVHIPVGEAAGGKVKFTIVASDGTNYAMETGEIIFLANPKQLNCAVVVSQYAVAPPGYTNTTLSIPPIGQSGSLNAQCSSTVFGGDPGMQIFDTAPTSFVPTNHKVYYTIENQSQASLTLQP